MLRFWTMRREALLDIAVKAVTWIVVAALPAQWVFWPLFLRPEAGLIPSQLMGSPSATCYSLGGSVTETSATCVPDGELLLVRADGVLWRWRTLPRREWQSSTVIYRLLQSAGCSAPPRPALRKPTRFTCVPSELVATAVGDVYRQRDRRVPSVLAGLTGSCDARSLPSW